MILLDSNIFIIDRFFKRDTHYLEFSIDINSLRT